MPWLGTLLLALGCFGVAAGAYTLTASLEHPPEYSLAMTNAMRAIGALIAILALLFGVVLLGYAALAYYG